MRNVVVSLPSWVPQRLNWECTRQLSVGVSSQFSSSPWARSPGWVTNIWVWLRSLGFISCHLQNGESDPLFGNKMGGTGDVPSMKLQWRRSVSPRFGDLGSSSACGTSLPPAGAGSFCFQSTLWHRLPALHLIDPSWEAEVMEVAETPFWDVKRIITTLRLPSFALKGPTSITRGYPGGSGGTLSMPALIDSLASQHQYLSQFLEMEAQKYHFFSGWLRVHTHAHMRDTYEYNLVLLTPPGYMAFRLYPTTSQVRKCKTWISPCPE